MKGCRVRGVVHFDRQHGGLACVDSGAGGVCRASDDDCPHQLAQPLPDPPEAPPKRMVKPLPIPKRTALEDVWAKGWPK